MKPIACCLFLVLTFPVIAQQHREIQTVEVIEVPVYVTGAAGSLTGLTRDNFELLVNGKPQSIDYFDVIDFSTVSSGGQPTPAAHRDMRQRRLYMLVFDLLFSTPNSIQRAQAAAEKLLTKAGEADEFAVAAFTHNRGLEIIVPFTRDRLTTTRAIRQLRTGAMADTLRLGMNNEEIAQLQEATSDTMRGESAVGEEVCDPRSACAELLRDRGRDTVVHQIQELGALAPRLAALEGQKHVVLLSNGFPPNLVTGVMPRPRPVDPKVTGQPDNTAKMIMPVGAPQSDPHSINALRKLAVAYGAAGVFLDAIDTAGLRPGGYLEENEALVMMARDTGGDVIDKDNDLTHALETLTDRERIVYVLGFHAHETRKKENAITVRLLGVEGHPDLRYRRTYSSIVDKPKRMDAIRLADIVINDIPQNGIEVLTEVDGTNVDVKIPLAPLLAQIDNRADLDVLLYVFSGNRAIATKEKRIAIDRDRVAAAKGNAAIHFAQQFDLPPGDYLAKVIVTMDGTTSAGFAREAFTVMP